LNNLQSRLNILANQLGLNSETYDQNSQKVIKRMVENEPKTDKQGDDFFDIKNQISYLLKELPNQERIINETDIAALKENYNYTIWSILAIGIIIGLIIINKKKN
jgi:CII-binding regulator of phage lambda lysogenization HflD